MADAVSVIIPTYNRRHVVGRAIESVLAQTVPVGEVIVVDDGSTDGTAAYLESLAAADSRIRLAAAGHGGAAAARNLGIGLATGGLIAFQDSDDEWEPDFLERLLPHVAGRTDVVAFVSHRVFFRDGSSEVVPAARIERPERELLLRSIASTQTMLLPAQLARDSGFDIGLRRFQDWDLCLTLLERGVTFVHEPSVSAKLYRLDDSISEGSTSIRSASLRRILHRHRSLFLRHPAALGRLIARAYLRPGVGSKGAVGTDPTGSRVERGATT
ncbi:glycosyltransferase family 2 protein [Agromyces sp. NPDC058110]|uniref:glycosyltransferase family 2 protein n=1 Tax=Agromyces sp. NPDC058110 TaxID=3346345 RepID=UPI0036D86411